MSLIRLSEMNPKVLIDLFFHQQPPLRAHVSVIRDDVLLGIRIFSALYLTGVYIYDFTILSSILVKFLYITNVAYFFSWLYFIIILQHYVIGQAKGLDQWAEIIFQAAFCLQWLITLAYWIVLRQDSYTNLDFYGSFNAHGITLILLIADFIFNGYRFIPTQYVTFIVICAVYLIVINMPYALGVRAVYGRAMDWVSWQTYLLIIGTMLISITVFWIGRVIYIKCKYPKLEGKQYGSSVLNMADQVTNLPIVSNINQNQDSHQNKGKPAQIIPQNQFQYIQQSKKEDISSNELGEGKFKIDK